MRLTKTSDSFGGMVWFRSQDRNDLWLEPCEMTAHDSRRAIDELAAYEDAEEQGLLVRLPCKVGDTVFRVVPKCFGPYIQCPFEGGHGLDRCYKCDAFIKEESFCFFMFDEIGKTVFLTCEEAEAALKGEPKEEEEND